MDATHLNSDRHDKLRHAIATLSGGLDRIARQMRAEGWYTADPALVAIEAAANAARAAIGVVLLADQLPPRRRNTVDPRQTS